MFPSFSKLHQELSLIDHSGDSPDGKMSMLVTKSRVYTNVLQQMPPSYYNYDNFRPETDDIDNYQLTQRLGNGKYSSVFEGVRKNALNEFTDPVAIKVLKPVRKRKIYREIKILECLRDGPNIIQLHAVVEIPHPRLTALIFDKMENSKDFKLVYRDFNQDEIRYYMFEVLIALNYCHSKGIMHRDVKPHNIIINVEQRKIRLIDWGLAEFYHPGHDYNVRVASRYFKGPELLVDYGYYDYSLDIWSLGCMFASMLFRKEPFFDGNCNDDQLYKIVRVLGSNKFMIYLQKYNITLPSSFYESLSHLPGTPWQRYIKTEKEYLIDDSALRLLESMLRYDHMERITAKEAMNHNYFKMLQRSGCSRNN